MTRNELVATANMTRLGDNPYPGRLIVVGMDKTGENAVEVYGIEGRGENSRNRVLSWEVGGRVFTEAADLSKMKDPSLIIYTAMKEEGRTFAVSNGVQTDSLASEGMIALDKYSYEPDFPNCTPRIAGMCFLCNCGAKDCRSPFFMLSILRKSLWGEECDRHFYTYRRIEPGYGFYVSTYTGNGDPLPSFVGEPCLMPIEGDIGNVALSYWEALDKENRVALVVKFIPLSGAPSIIRVINKYEKVG